MDTIRQGGAVRGAGRAGAGDRMAGRKKKDRIKNEYCKNNSIKLIRIPYKQFDNIENILEKEMLDI